MRIKYFIIIYKEYPEDMRINKNFVQMRIKYVIPRYKFGYFFK